MMIKRASILVMLTLIFSSMFINYSFVNAQTPDSYQSYQNTQYGFAIKYPQSWNLVEHLGPQYAIKTVLISPNNNLQINAGIIKDNNPYPGLTSQEILGHITGMMRDSCSSTTMQNRAFTCSNPQFFANTTSYRGITTYDVTMKWVKTFSSGQTLKWLSTWGMMPYGKDVWILIMEGSTDEIVKQSQNIVDVAESFDVINIPQSTSKVAKQPSVPTWVKNTVKWWSEGSLTDDDFIKGIQFLVQNKIIKIKSTVHSSSNSNTIPNSVKNNAKWWSEGSLTDDDFIKSMQYLVEQGIISTSIKPKTLDTVTQSVNIRGATMNLPTGSNVIIPPNLVSSSQSATLSLLSSLPEQPPSGALVSTGPALALVIGDQQVSYMDIFGIIQQASAQIDAGKIMFSMKLDNTPLSNKEAFSQIAYVIDSRGNHNFQGIKASYDKPSNTENFEVDSSVAQSAKAIMVGSVDPSPSYKQSDTGYGPKMWDGIKFTSIAETGDGNLYQVPTGKKTLVLVHGIFSNVDAAFNQETAGGSCIEKIMKSGGYDQVVGFDYDYTDNIANNGEKLAQFLNQLKSNGDQIDVQAHSLGTIVSLYALQRSQAQVNNMVLLGGPIDGTPVTKYGLTTFLANAGSIGSIYSSDLSKMSDNHVLDDIQPGSDFLKSLKNNAITKHGNTNFIRVVGEKTPWYIPTSFGPFKGIPNDGIIPVSSARGEGLPGPILTYPDLSHTDLECDKEVIANVGTVLKPMPSTTANTNTPPSGSINQPSHTGTQIGGQGGYTQGQSVRGCGGYKTCEQYCQYEIGGEYHYDASTNTCRINPYQSSEGSSGGSSGGSSSGGSSSGSSTLSAARDLTGNWGGSYTVIDNNFGTTTFHSSFTMSLSQSGNSLSGTVSYASATSVEKMSNGNPKGAIDGRTVRLSGTISASSFTATSDDGSIKITGSFTTDLIQGTFTECSSGLCSSGSFSGSRR